MNIRAYKVEHDWGFAPNPFFGVCTLACCRPIVRAKAKEGDLILGLGTKATGTLGRLTYWMIVDEVTEFERYFDDRRFQKKKANVLSAKRRRYGDNVYWRDEPNGPLLQTDCFHAHPDPVERQKNIDNDTGLTENVLIGRQFGYYGDSGPQVPGRFGLLTKKGLRYRCNFPEPEYSEILAWAKTLRTGYLGDPANWKTLPAS